MPHSTIDTTADGKQQPRQQNLRQPVIVVQPDVEAMLRQVGRVLGHQPGVVVLGFAHQDPAHVRPPTAIVRRVRIARQIGFLVVDAMRGHPENRAAFEGQRAADRKQVLQGQRHLVRAVGMQPVVAHADAQPRGEPQQEQQ
jgi:hypothetical protein